jgi:hypothetical protein
MRWMFSMYLILPEVKKDEMGGACSMNGEKRNAYRIDVGGWTISKWILGR